MVDKKTVCHNNNLVTVCVAIITEKKCINLIEM